jgi:hypothetical protein
VSSPVLAPAILISFRADWVQLSPTCGEGDAIRRDTEFNEGFTGRPGSLAGENQVVNDVTAFIGITFERDDYVGMGFQPLSVAGQDCPIFWTEIGAIEIEMNIVYILLKLLLFIGRKRCSFDELAIVDGNGVANPCRIGLCWRLRLSGGDADKTYQQGCEGQDFLAHGRPPTELLSINFEERGIGWLLYCLRAIPTVSLQPRRNLCEPHSGALRLGYRHSFKWNMRQQLCHL